MMTNAFASDTGTSGWLVRAWPLEEVGGGIRGIAQAEDGFLWISTADYLARFDGFQFEKFQRRDLPGADHRLRIPMADNGSSLWVAGDGGFIWRFNGGKATVFTNSIPNVVPVSMVQDADKAIWIGYSHGIVCRIKEGRIKIWSKENGLPSGGTVTLAVDKQGAVWFANDGQIGVIRDDRFMVQLHLNNVTTHLVAASGGGFWIFSGTQLLKFREGTVPVVCGSVSDISPNLRVNVLLEDHAGALWAGTQDNGLVRFDGRQFENIPVSHQTVTGLLEDRDGTIWATAGGDLDRIHPQAIVAEKLGGGFPTKAVSLLCENVDGTLWACNKDGSVVHHIRDKWNEVPMALNQANCMAVDQSGSLWIGTRHYDVARYKNGALTLFGKESGLASHTYRSILATASGDIWVTGESPRTTLYRLRDGKAQAFSLPPSVGRPDVMVADSAGTIWIGGTGEALLMFKPGNPIKEVHAPPIRSLCLTKDGTLWLACNGHGLGRLKNGQLIFISTDQGLYSDHIAKMVDDERGWLWFGAVNGIFKVRQSELNAVADGHLAHVQSIHYGEEEGIPALHPGIDDQPSAICTRDGRLWFPMGSTLVMIDPNKLHDHMEPPDLLIKKVSVDDHVLASCRGLISDANTLDLKTVKTLRVPSGYRRLQFDFTALGFGTLDNVRFLYQLEGFDSGWNEGEPQRTAVYPKLPPGDYHFRVKACNSSGVWNETGASVAFTVMPLVWQTRWFQVASFAAFAFLAGTVVRFVSHYRLRLRLRKLQEQSALELERSRIARDLHDELGSQLTRIVLINDLARNRLSPSDSSAGHAQQISSMLRQSIQALDETVWAINPRNDTVPRMVNYIGQFAVEFLKPTNIRCRLDLPHHLSARPVLAETRHNLFLAVKEALNNSVRHGDPSEIWLRVSVLADSLTLTIEDNGQGFHEASAPIGADGLQNMRQRMEEIGGQFQIQSAAGRGTSVMFTLPLSR